MARWFDRGTAAALDVPAAGDASSSQVVKGTDTRLTDSRTPVAHHTTHETGGSDVVTVDISQVQAGPIVQYLARQYFK